MYRCYSYYSEITSNKRNYLIKVMSWVYRAGYLVIVYIQPKF